MKKILLIFSLFLVLAVPMRAQVFIMEEDENEFRNVFGNGEWNNVIYHGSGDDQTDYVPLGSGIALLVALGGASLLNRRKKTQEEEK
jgi:hypothetical protein